MRGRLLVVARKGGCENGVLVQVGVEPVRAREKNGERESETDMGDGGERAKVKVVVVFGVWKVVRGTGLVGCVEWCWGGRCRERKWVRVVLA